MILLSLHGEASILALRWNKLIGAGRRGLAAGSGVTLTEPDWRPAGRRGRALLAMRGAAWRNAPKRFYRCLASRSPRRGPAWAQASRRCRGFVFIHPALQNDLERCVRLAGRTSIDRCVAGFLSPTCTGAVALPPSSRRPAVPLTRESVPLCDRWLRASKRHCLARVGRLASWAQRRHTNQYHQFLDQSGGASCVRFRRDGVERSVAGQPLWLDNLKTWGTRDPGRNT